MIRTVIAASLLLIATTLSATPQADKVLIQKSARQLTLFRNGKTLRSYHVSLGSHPKGAKEREGDGRTPEGFYTIDSGNAYSKYHLALHVSYPNAADGARARRQRVSPGGEIMIHGTPNRWRWLSFVFPPRRLDGWMYRSSGSRHCGDLEARTERHGGGDPAITARQGV